RRSLLPHLGRRLPLKLPTLPTDTRHDMAAFNYSAINAQGLELKGELHAPDLAAAMDQLRSRGLLPQKLTEAKGVASGAGKGFKKVAPKSLQVFSRQFATLIEAGVSIV